MTAGNFRSFRDRAGIHAVDGPNASESASKGLRGGSGVGKGLVSIGKHVRWLLPLIVIGCGTGNAEGKTPVPVLEELRIW